MSRSSEFPSLKSEKLAGEPRILQNTSFNSVEWIETYQGSAHNGAWRAAQNQTNRKELTGLAAHVASGWVLGYVSPRQKAMEQPNLRGRLSWDWMTGWVKKTCAFFFVHLELLSSNNFPSSLGVTCVHHGCPGGDGNGALGMRSVRSIKISERRTTHGGMRISSCFVCNRFCHRDHFKQVLFPYGIDVGFRLQWWSEMIKFNFSYG